MYGFECKCQLCLIDKGDPKLKVRNQLIDNHMKDVRSEILLKEIDRFIIDKDYVQLNLDRVEAELAEIKKTYAERSKFTMNITYFLQSQVILYKYDDDHLKVARICEDIYEMNKTYDLAGSLYVLADAYNSYNILGKKEEALICYRLGAELFFPKCDAYYKYIFQKVLDDLKGFLSDIKELRELS